MTPLAVSRVDGTSHQSGRGVHLAGLECLAVMDARRPVAFGTEAVTFGPVDGARCVSHWAARREELTVRSTWKDTLAH
jgi:hypothetical protein